MSGDHNVDESYRTFNLLRLKLRVVCRATCFGCERLGGLLFLDHVTFKLV